MVGSVLLLLDDPSRVLDVATPLLRADDLGVVRGEAVFETLRVAGGRPAFLDLHLRRLRRSADRVGIDLPGGWAELAAAAAATQDDGMLRLTCTKGAPGAAAVGFAVAGPLPPETVRGREQGVRVATMTLGVAADVRRDAPWLLGGVKSTSYAVNMATQRAAQQRGLDDAIWVSADGEVLEAPTATVAVVREGRVATPPADEVGILPGTTAEATLACSPLPVDVRRVRADELPDADEVMLLSSVRGVAPVVELDGRPLPVGPVTTALRDAYEAAVRA
ncbi:MAG: aminotransferase class IV [Actinomycetes bacterium]